MIGRAFLSLLALACSAAHGADGHGPKMLERMAQLEGAWEGSYSWSSGRAGGALKASYYVTGNGSAVVENLIMGVQPSMTSVYHLDGQNLRMTHFCAARNQPRLRAAEVDAEAGHASFTFVDATNVTPKNPAHVRQASIRIIDRENLEIQFVFEGGASSATETILLRRAAKAE